MTKRTFDFKGRMAQLNVIVEAAVGNTDRKSPERKAAARAQRKLKQISAFEELLRLIPKDAELSEDTSDYINSLATGHSASTIDVQEGDSLIELLEEYKDVRDLYKKILKQCERKGLQIKGTEIVKK